MNASSCGRQVLRWTWRCASRPAPTSAGLDRHGTGQYCLSHRALCSTRQKEPPKPGSTQLAQRPEFSISSLIEMGFTEKQAEQVYEGVTRNRAKHNTCTLTVLFSLGLNPYSVSNILEKCPELYSVKGQVLQQRITNLRKLGLLEGSVQRVVSHYPHILVITVKKVNMVARLLQERCLFTVQQVTDILRDSSEVLEEDLNRIEFKFQYAYFRMGVRQADMVKAKLFRVSLMELQCRHCFLERRGLYQTPDKKGQTTILNPKLYDFLGIPEDIFLSTVATATREEFDVFRQMIAREMEEEQQADYSSDEEEDDSDRVEDDEDVEDKEEMEEGRGRNHHWNTGYNRRKR